MNIELLTAVRDELRTEPDAFDPSAWLEVKTLPDGRWAATAFDIAGLAVLIGDPDMITITLDGFAPHEPYRFDMVDRHARQLLGLTYEQAIDLFTPPTSATNSLAAEVVDRLISTGLVHWK